MLKEAIAQTLKYFDIQDHPLTLLEISKYLLRQESGIRYKLFEILEAVESMSEVETFNGFYYLKGRKAISQKRWQSSLYSTPRMNRAQKFLPFMRHLPFIRAVAVSGSEAINNSGEGSDIDLLILSAPRRIWLARVFATAYFQVLGMRRHGPLVANRFCLNHYIEQGKELAYDRNIYTAIEYVSLIPYFGGRNIYDFQKRNLPWISEYLSQPMLELKETPLPSAFQRTFEALLANKAGDSLERMAGYLQQRRIRKESNIVIEKDELSFHPESKGQSILQKFDRKY